MFNHSSSSPLVAAAGPSRSAIAVMAAAAVLSLFLWNQPGFSMAFYPFKLLVTFIHESCHGTAALLTGGWWQQFTVSPDGSGLALTSGGFRPLVISAGYLGSSIVGALMLIAATHRNWARVTLTITGCLLACVTLVYGRNMFAFITGILLAGGLLGVAYFSRGIVASLLLTFTAVLNSLYAVRDLLDLVQISRYSNVPTDAQNMAQLTLGVVPAIVWAVIWLLMALGILALALYFIFRRRRSRGERTA